MKPVGLAIQINVFPFRRLKARSIKNEATVLQYIFKYTTKVKETANTNGTWLIELSFYVLPVFREAKDALALTDKQAVHHIYPSRSALMTSCVQVFEGASTGRDCVVCLCWRSRNCNSSLWRSWCLTVYTWGECVLMVSAWGRRYSGSMAVWLG